MAGSLLDRAFGILDLLARNAAGLPLQRIADAIGSPKSAAHRLLGELIRLGFVRQDPMTAHYLLTTQLVTMGFTFLASSGVTDIAQPVLDRLAGESGELVRLAVVDDRKLTWVSKAQGARSGLRYDPEMGGHPVVFCTATGQAWLATLDDTTLHEVLAKEGFGKLGEHGPNAPRTLQALQRKLNKTRADGFAVVVESAAVGASAIACAITLPSGRAIGTVSIAGPSFRLTEKRMRELAPAIVAAARELSAASAGSDYLSASIRSVS